MSSAKYTSLPNGLKKYRRARGLTQKQVARLLRLKSSSLISRWEKGVCLPKPMTIFKLAILYRTMADALFIDLRRVLTNEVRRREAQVLTTERDRA